MPAAAGGTCNSSCATNTTADSGYIATCLPTGAWAISGGCATCVTPPNNTLALNSGGWNASCAPAAVGSVCLAACNNIAAGGGYRAVCTAAGTWAINGSCATCLAPPSTATPGSPVGWNASCAPSSLGGECTAACSVNMTIGSGYTAVCMANGTWAVSGGCATCVAPPDSSLAAWSTGWNASCAPAGVGGVCSAACSTASAGNGYTALCLATGNWSIAGGCSHCPSLPSSMPPGSVGWDPGCAPAAIGAVCTAGCALNTSVGTAYTAVCTAVAGNATWVISGKCAACLVAPDDALAPDSAGWDDACAPVAAGGRCAAACNLGFSGGFSANCSANGTWLISGSCTGAVTRHDSTGCVAIGVGQAYTLETLTPRPANTKLSCAAAAAAVVRDAVASGNAKFMCSTSLIFARK